MPMPAATDAAKDWKDAKDAKPKPKPVTIERNFDPKKLISYVNNPKFSLVEQRRDLDDAAGLRQVRERRRVYIKRAQRHVPAHVRLVLDARDWELRCVRVIAQDYEWLLFDGEWPRGVQVGQA